MICVCKHHSCYKKRDTFGLDSLYKRNEVPEKWFL